jgi:hypothetical protein
MSGRVSVTYSKVIENHISKKGRVIETLPVIKASPNAVVIPGANILFCK